MNDNTVYVVIPSYNEAATIKQVVNKVLAITPNVIVIDDGSTDTTIAELNNLPITLLKNPSNTGKAASLMRGIKLALAQKATVIITMDGDDQHEAADIPKLIKAFTVYPNKLIIAARLENNSEAPSNRLFANRFADFWVSWASGHKVQDSQSGFRLYPASLFKKVQARHSKYRSFVFESEIIINAAHHGYLTQSVAIKSRYPEQRRISHYRPWSDVTKTVLMIAGKIIQRGFNVPGLIRVLREYNKK